MSMQAVVLQQSLSHDKVQMRQNVFGKNVMFSYSNHSSRNTI